MKKIKKFIMRNKWTFAKTMPEIPHYYVVRDNLSDKDKKIFDEFSEFIKKRGHTAKFYSKEYTCLNINNYKYWVIENILNREKIKDVTIPDDSPEKRVPVPVEKMVVKSK